MAYENIRFVKPNMEFVDGYFYNIDDNSDMMVQKVDDGSIVYSYPLDTLIGSTVKSLQYDGANFWTLQDESTGFVIKRWRIDNNIVKLKDTFSYSDTSKINYDADTFAVENYRTQFNCTVSGGAITICPDEYYDSVIVSGTVLTLGPNKLNEREEVIVNSVVGSNVMLVSGTQYAYEIGDPISMYKSFFVFNNYTGLSSSKGDLMRFNAYTGDLIVSDSRTDYKNITACTFTRVKNLLRDCDDANTIIFVKDTQARFRNMSDLINILRADSVNDNFTDSDGSLPNSTRWDVTYGNPRIYNNELFCSTVINGKDEIVSNYEILDDFSAQISGSTDGYTTFSGASFEHYMRLIFENNSYCEISRVYDESFGDGIAANSSESGYVGLVTTSGGITFNNYEFMMDKVGTNVNCYYKAMTSGIFDVNWHFLGTISVSESNSLMCLGLHSSAVTVSGAYFDNLIYNYGYIRYPSVDTPYYDVMSMDNIRSNGSTIIPITDISYYNGNLYRLQNEGTYYGSDNYWGSMYNYVCSPVRSFVDSITVDVYPVILPANARNVAMVTCIVMDQYSNGAINKPINFTDTDDRGYITINPQYTDAINATGKAITYYVSGIDRHTVTIRGTVTQYD